MLKKVIKYTIGGIMWGCTISSLVCLIGVLNYGNEWFLDSPRSYAAQIIASMIVGIAWVLPTMVYRSEKISYALKVLIHMTIGFIVYLPCAFYMGWLPIDGGIISVLLDVLFTIVVSFAIWFCFWLYARKEARDINRKIKEKM